MTIPATDLNTIQALNHLPTFNGLAQAHSHAMVFGIRERKSVKLHMSFHGGNISIDGVPTFVPNQDLNLTASATNYIWHDFDGVVFGSTSAPTGWPGPLTSGGAAMYEVLTNTTGVISGTSYLVGKAGRGPQGPTGPQGVAGAAIYQQRKRYLVAIGNNETYTAANFGLDYTNGGTNTRGVATSSFSESVPYFAAVSLIGARNIVYLGDAANRGGFDVSFRWAMDTSFSSSGQRTFAGLFNVSGSAMGSTDPSAMANIIGVGKDTADSNYSVMHNDASGTATKIALGASFVAFGAKTLFEARFTSEANSGVVDYAVRAVNTSGTITDASGTISTNLPANTQYLCPLMNADTGRINPLQIILSSRY